MKLKIHLHSTIQYTVYELIVRVSHVYAKYMLKIFFFEYFCIKSDIFFHWKMIFILWWLILHLGAFLIFCPIKMLAAANITMFAALNHLLRS